MMSRSFVCISIVIFISILRRGVFRLPHPGNARSPTRPVFCDKHILSGPFHSDRPKNHHKRPMYSDFRFFFVLFCFCFFFPRWPEFKWITLDGRVDEYSCMLLFSYLYAYVWDLNPFSTLGCPNPVGSVVISIPAIFFPLCVVLNNVIL